MKQKIVVGYVLSDQFCQISYYHDNLEEPKTLEISGESQIPLLLGYSNQTWSYGLEAKRLLSINQERVVTGLFSKALAGQKVQIGEEVFEAKKLLAKFIQMSLRQFGVIDYITFVIERDKMTLNMEEGLLLKEISQDIGLPEDKVYIQEFKESFCRYMFCQPQEFWQYEAVLFHCDKEEVRAYILRRLSAENRKKKEGDSFVTVEEVASATMKEIHKKFPLMDIREAQEADARFSRFVEGVFDKKVISSVFLTGEGFENNWYPETLKVMCNGRRVFAGNNLYSKGACYTSYQRQYGYSTGLVYLDDTKMTERICIRLRTKGVEDWFPIVSWGEHWYGSDKQYELLLENNDDIELRVESVWKEEQRVITVPLTGLENRSNYSIRLRMEIVFMDEETCKIVFYDIGFGEFFPETEFRAEITVELGGSNGQFNSLF